MTAMPAPATGTSPFLQAVGLGALLALGGTAIAVALGVGGEDRAYVLPGAFAAVLSVGVATLFHRRLFAESQFRDPQMLSTQVQSLLAMSLLAKLAVLAAGAGGLALMGAKFSSIGVFAVAFAAAALICQMVAAGVLSRSFRGRAPVRPSESRRPES